MNYPILGVALMLALLMSANLKGQNLNDDRMKHQRAVLEAESILSEADKIDNLLVAVKVKAKAASVLWTQSPEKARAVFIKLWDKVDGQTDKSFDKEEARIALLPYLFSKDRALANQLLKRSAGEDENVSDFDKINGKDPETRRLAFTAYRLAERDAVLAAAVLEQSLASGTAPMAQLTLARLREKDPLLANYVASRAIESFNRQPRTVAVIGLNTLIAYLFPYTPLPAVSPEVIESDENLRFQFMSTGYQILKESLAESNDFLVKEQQLSAKSLDFRGFSQAMLAAILTTLSTRYAPQNFAELDEITRRLIIGLPKQLADAIQIQTAVIRGGLGEVETSEVSEAEILSAMAKGDFNAAQNLIDKLKNETKKKTWTQLLLKAQTNFYLANNEILLALNTARKIENAAQRMLLLAETAKAAHKRRDQVLSVDILQEARKTSADSLPKGTRATTLFTIAAETAYFSVSESLLTLQDAVSVVNSMTYSIDDSRSAGAALNDPNRFVDSLPMIRAFAALSDKNMDDAFLIAGKLENKPVQMTAKLAAIEKILKKRPSKVK